MQLALFEDVLGCPHAGPDASLPANGESELPQGSFCGASATSDPSRPPAPEDSDAFLATLWQRLQRQWYPERSDLLQYTLQWSKRSQKRTLASCNLLSFRVIVARELNYREHWGWLEPLLYHEMCHAYLRSPYHNRSFYLLEKRHPGIRPFDSWIDCGGWSRAVRSDRAKRVHLRRRATSGTDLLS